MRTSMDMLNGSLWDKIFKFSMPVAATAILEQFFTATDVVIAGNFANSDRTAAMAAVGTDLPIIGMIIFCSWAWPWALMLLLRSLSADVIRKV